VSGIICAIRGGPASRPTIVKAIELAKEHHLPLYFLYVVNLEFLTHTASSRVHTISRELNQMGEFILLAAQTEAETNGVTAQGFVRQGIIWDEIISLGQEFQVDYVVLGKPLEQEDNFSTFEFLQIFSERIENEVGADVVLAKSQSN
jgi:nucleotide-binding universal stress UspA family protein